MPTATLIIVAVVIIAVLVVAGLWYSGQRRSRDLREQFGPEYKRAVAETGDRGRAEQELAARQERVSQLEIRDLLLDEQRRFSEEWRAVQAHFVDDPAAAVRDADGLVGRVMQARGYPVGDFDQRAADVSVDHPAVVAHYRAAHDVALRQEQGHASTEDLRQAMVDYRSLFADLLGEPQAGNAADRQLRAAS